MSSARTNTRPHTTEPSTLTNCFMKQHVASRNDQSHAQSLAELASARVNSALFAKGIVYLKVDCNLEFPDIGLKLAPSAIPESFEHDSENVYEWMYVRISELPFALNVFREHGWADIDDELLDFESEATQDELNALVTLGPVYIFGWNRESDTYVDELPDWLPQFVADRLLADVFVYKRRINIAIADGDPIVVALPRH